MLRALEDMAAKERIMYELDHRKDQVMTVYKVALANLAMWVRDHYFPASYAHATWLRLVPFFRLPAALHAMRPPYESNCVLSMIEFSMVTWLCSVLASTTLPPDSRMDTNSPLASVPLPLVPYFLPRSSRERDSLGKCALQAN
jgi:hypothetical protein